MHIYAKVFCVKLRNGSFDVKFLKKRVNPYNFSKECNNATIFSLRDALGNRLLFMRYPRCNIVAKKKTQYLVVDILLSMS